MLPVEPRTQEKGDNVEGIDENGSPVASKVLFYGNTGIFKTATTKNQLTVLTSDMEPYDCIELGACRKLDALTVTCKPLMVSEAAAAAHSSFAEHDGLSQVDSGPKLSSAGLLAAHAGPGIGRRAKHRIRTRIAKLLLPHLRRKDTKAISKFSKASGQCTHTRLERMRAREFQDKIAAAARNAGTGIDGRYRY